MNQTFLETTGFSESREEFLPDTAYATLQRLLMADPDAGDVIPGCGGLRKLRTADPKRGKGKRGGARVIYLSVPEAYLFYMIDIYSKEEKDDLSPADKKLFQRLADEIKAETVDRYNKWLEENAR